MSNSLANVEPAVRGKLNALRTKVELAPPEVIGEVKLYLAHPGFHGTSDPEIGACREPT